MALNLGKKNCSFCTGKVQLTGAVHLISQADLPKDKRIEEVQETAEFVADAECSECGAKYISWHVGFEKKILDLSFRSTFSSEPGLDDLPNTFANLQQKKDTRLI